MSIRQPFFGGAVAAFAMAAALSVTPAPAKADNNPYIGDIMMTGANFCPRSWAAAKGQLLAISSNTALFSLIGTTYGGDGRTTFALPDLQGRVATGQGRGPGLSQRSQGQKYGVSTYTLTTQNMPQHSHSVFANNLDGDKAGPGNKLLAAAPPSGTGSETIYSQEPATRQMASGMIGTSGGNQPIIIADPSLVITYCIALVGVYPSRS